MASNSRIHKAQLLDEYNNQYTALTSVDSLYHTNGLGNKESVVSILTGINYINYGTTNSSSGENFSLVYNNIPEPKSAGINTSDDYNKILGNAELGSISIKDFLGLTYIQRQIGNIASNYINEGTNAFSFNFKNYIFTDGIKYVRDRWTGFTSDNGRAQLSWQSPMTYAKTNWSLIFPNESTGTASSFNSHIIWSESISPNWTNTGTYRIIPWQNEVEAAISDAFNKADASIKALQNNQKIYIGGGCISVNNTANTISLNYGTGLSVQNNQLVCTVTSSSSGPTYSASTGISISSDYKISVKRKYNGGLAADSSGFLYVDTSALNISGGTTYSTGSGISISGTQIGIDSTWLTMSSDNQTLNIGTNKNLKCDKNIEAEHFYASSDISLKYDPQPIDNDENIPVPLEFKWISNDKKSYGFIAQDLRDHYPELVSESKPGAPLSVDYMSALSLVIGKLMVKINKLEKRIEELENK